MNKRSLITSIVLLLSILACNLSAGKPSTPVPVIAETSTNTPIPTFTLIPSDTPPPTFTATPTIPIVWPLDKGVNCRFGPSTDWATVSSLLVGQTATIEGKNRDATWWYITTINDPDKPCWVSANVTLTAGNLSNLPVMDPPAAQVTGVSIKLEPKEIILPGCIGPVQPIAFKGEITVNGPAKVEWHFETAQGGSMLVHSIEFKNADTKTVEESFTPFPPAGSYWVKLIITKPNDKAGEVKYKITCP
jgi:hypothetical protein